VYKALYRLFGGFVADVVAAIDQVCKSIYWCFISNVLLPKTSYVKDVLCSCWLIDSG
jgi:hypothetical protein